MPNFSLPASSERYSRREILRAGLTGFSLLGLADILRARAATAAPQGEKTAIILVWLRGGASHLETFDTKPEAPLEYRGPFGTIDTNVPGIRVGELLPRLSQCADRYSLLRSVAHTGGGHPSGSLQVLGGDPDAQDKLHPVFPDWMTVVSHLRRNPGRALPNYIAVNPVDNYDNFQIAGPGYLGATYEPFKVLGDPSAPQFAIPNIGLKPEELPGLERRMTLQSGFDRLRRGLDLSGTMDAVDGFRKQALGLLTSPQAQQAFDLTQEDDRLRDRYGRNAWGAAVPAGPSTGRSGGRCGGDRVRRAAVWPGAELGRPRRQSAHLRGLPVPHADVRPGGLGTDRRCVSAGARPAGAGGGDG